MFPRVYIVSAPGHGRATFVAAFDNREAAEALAALDKEYKVVSINLQSRFIAEDYE